MDIICPHPVEVVLTDLLKSGGGGHGPPALTALNIQSRKAAGTSQTHSLQSFTTKVTKFSTVQYRSIPPRRQERGGVQGKQARSILHIDCRADNFGILRLLYVLTLYFFRKLGRKTEQFTLCRFRTTFFSYLLLLSVMIYGIRIRVFSTRNVLFSHTCSIFM